jgi:hypothetical protein
VAHEILVGVAEDVVVLGAVFREIELRLLEDGDEVGEPLDHGVALAELVGVVEVREVALGEPGVGLEVGRFDVGEVGAGTGVQVEMPNAKADVKALNRE